MIKSAKRVAAVTALATAALAAPVGAVHAATSPQRAVPQVSCTWNPANNSNVAASFNTSGVNIRTGPSTGCTAIGAGYPGQSVTLRCEYYNSSDGRYWAYLTDNTTGKRGWSADTYVNWSGWVLAC